MAVFGVCWTRGKTKKGCKNGGVCVAEKSAPIHRNGKPEALVDTRGHGRQVSSPGDAGDSNAVGINFRKRPKQRVGEQDVSHRLIRPLIFHQPIHLLKCAIPSRAVPRTRGVADDRPPQARRSHVTACCRRCPWPSRHSPDRSTA